MLNTPLPGDFVIRPLDEERGLRRVVVFIVTVWPTLEVIGGPYQSYGYAHRQAKAMVAKRGVQLWREHSSDRDKQLLENVSEADG